MDLMSLVRLGAQCVASGLGSGYSRIAPGTCGSVAALGVWWILSRQFEFGTGTAVVLVLLVSVLGYIATGICLLNAGGEHDPGWIVIDEWAGLYLALVSIAPGEWGMVLLAFGLFRLLDATKVWPVGWAERLPGAWGVMADDLVAGAITALIVSIVRIATHL